MLERYQGKDGRAALLNALRSQFIVDGHSDVADRLASAAQVREYAPGAVLFDQGDRGSDLSFILAGSVLVRVDGREIATCGPGMHIGEIGLLEPFKGRSAAVVAIDTVVVAQVTAQQFTDVARFHPELWRRIAIELARRLVKSQALLCRLGGAEIPVTA
ncbi:MAG TPA: cyclic nucleotide-binding domain-containing protein [Burkholderiales bacterium]|nr:cyclic nucleotide-binding domain-containing protein [Burkholderiales bacterium]